MVHGVHRGHDGGERLRGAEVGRGFLTPDVLLARAEGETERGVAMGIL